MRFLLIVLLTLSFVLTVPCYAQRISGNSITTIQTGHWETVQGRVWIPPYTYRNFVQPVFFRGKLIQQGRWESYTEPGRWETYCRRIWVDDGRW